MTAVAWAAAVIVAAVLLAAPAEAAKPSCGDGKCSGGETADSCSQDCGSVGGGTCGDRTCDADETCSSCATDCGSCPPVSCNFDGICNDGEDCIGCLSDCPGVTSGKPSNRYCCGLDTCDPGLCGAGACTSTPSCGNGIVEFGEECDDGNVASGDGCDASCLREPPENPAPINQFNIGDSIGEGEAANDTIGSKVHKAVWSTGYDGGDPVDSLNERFEAVDGANYDENNADRDSTFNQAKSGAVMADFASQALDVVSESGATPGGAGMVTVLLGNNDVCAPSLDAMTDPAEFEAQYRAGLDVLAENPETRDATIHVSSIPAIYWLWNAKRGDFLCRTFIWPFVPCQNLLKDSDNDCESAESRLDPDTIYPGDGSACVRRKTFHARIRDIYNPILEDVLTEYRQSEALPNAEYVDIFDVPFDDGHVNDGDCFHPSKRGHALLAGQEWCRSKWGVGDPMCAP